MCSFIFYKMNNRAFALIFMLLALYLKLLGDMILLLTYI